MKTLAGLNYSRKEVALTEPTSFRGCNLVLARLVTNGHAWEMVDCNRRGLYVDGVKQDAFTIQHHEPHPVAVAVLDACRKYAGEDGEAAWLHGIQVVLDGPDGITYDDVKAAHVAWASTPGVNNLVFWDAAVQTIWAVFFAGFTWAQLVGAIRLYDLATWAGEATQLIHEEG